MSSSRLPDVPWPSAAALVGLILSLAGARLTAIPDRCPVPPSIREPLLHEISGENTLRHVEFLAANRDRQRSEYLEKFFETTYLTERLAEYGVKDVKVDYFPAGQIWDAEEAELWIVQPARKKIASLTMVPAALASGSASAEVEAEVVYVGAGREADYAGKNVAGKIALGNASVTGIFSEAVNRRGAVGALGTGSAGVSANSAGYTLDQIGWQSVEPKPGGSGFGFVLSLRQFTELRDLLERGTQVVLRARVRTRMHPYRLNVTSASIPGTNPASNTVRSPRFALRASSIQTVRVEYLASGGVTQMGVGLVPGTVSPGEQCAVVVPFQRGGWRTIDVPVSGSSCLAGDTVIETVGLDFDPQRTRATGEVRIRLVALLGFSQN